MSSTQATASPFPASGTTVTLRGDANPGIFWYWNCDPSEAMMTRQLTAMRDAGFRSVCLHPMPQNFRPSDFHAGMRIAYLGQRYFQHFRRVVDECRRLGLLLILYDEGGWPSGTACGKVVRGNPEFAARVLVRDGAKQFRTVPADPAGWRSDLMNPDATRKFLRLVHERYRAAAPEEFGRTIRGIFTDEPTLSGAVGTERVPWSPLLPEEFRRCNGFAVEKIYPFLFAPAGDSAEAARAQRLYLECCTKLFARNFFGVIASWCHANSISLEGHLAGEHLITSHAAIFGDYLKICDRFDVPGVDTIARQIHPASGDGAFAKLALSAAVRNGRRETLSESFNVYGPGDSTTILNHVANAQFVRGISRLMVMPFLASANGVRKISCGTDFSPRNPLWRLFPALTAHWNWAGNFDPGAVKPRVWVRYRPLLPLASPDETEERNRAWNAFLTELDDRWIPWRFAGVEETPPAGTLLLDPENPFPREMAAKYAFWNPLATRGKFRILPCRRRDGTEAVMVFCDERDGGLLQFAAKEEWEELPPPDVLPGRLAPLRKIPGGYEAQFAPGELRIFRRRSSAPENVLPPLYSAGWLRLDWQVDMVEKLHLGPRPAFRRRAVGKALPASGDYTEQEPGFSGVLHLSAELECGTAPLPEALRFRHLWSGGTLRVNGRQTGMRAFAPWVFRLDRLRPGRNRLELEVVGTPALEWLRARRGEWLPAGCSNGYCNRIAGFPPEETRCGVSPEVELLSPNFR